VSGSATEFRCLKTKQPPPPDHARHPKSAIAPQEKADSVVAELRRQKLTRAAELVEERIRETLTYYAFPDSHWSKIRTNNPLERIMEEIRRRTRVVGAFPDGQSCLNLAAARLRHIADTQWSTRRYMTMDPLYANQQTTSGAVA
jgi:transposase-like protein